MNYAKTAMILGIGLLVVLLATSMAGCQATGGRTTPSEGNTTTTIPLIGTQRTEWSDVGPAQQPPANAVDAAQQAVNAYEAQANAEAAAKDLQREKQERREVDREEAERRRAAFNTCVAIYGKGVTGDERQAVVCDCHVEHEYNVQGAGNFQFTRNCPSAPASAPPVERGATAQPPPLEAPEGRLSGVKGKDWSMRLARQAIDAAPETGGFPRRRWSDLSPQCQNALAVAVEALDPAVVDRVSSWLPQMAQRPAVTARYLLQQEPFLENLLDGGEDAWALAAERCAQ